MAHAAIPATVDNVHVDTLRMRAPKIFADASDETGRNLAIVGLMERYGRIQYGVNVSYANKWRIRYKLLDAKPYPKSGNITFPSTDQWKEANIDVRGFIVDQSVTWWDWMNNGMGKSDDQTISLLADRSAALVNSARFQFNKNFLYDGNASGYTELFHGIESCLGAGTVVAADVIAAPSDDYAGLSTVFANYGGSGQWTTGLTTKPNASLAVDWPWGNGPVEADFNCPLLVNTSSTSWQSGTDFADNGEEVLRFMGDAQTHRCKSTREGGGDVPMFHLLGSVLINKLKEYFSTKGVILQEYKEARDFGLASTLEFEGNMISTDFHVAATEGYCIDPSALEYFTPFAKLWDVEGPDWRYEMQKFLFLLRSIGNFRLKPRHLGKYKAYA